jgi:hypothetical protein
VTVEQWQEIGIVCGALIALLTLIGLLYTKVARPVWRAAWRTIRRLNEVADDLLGDKAKGVPSMTQRMAAVERGQREHLDWHSARGRANGPQPAGRTGELR